MSKKSTRQMSAKPSRRGYSPPGIGQKPVGKFDRAAHGSRILRRLQNNLGQMVDSLSGLKKMRRYETIATELSELAGLNNGHVWGWRYVASVLSGSTLPSKKFIDAVSLRAQKINPRKKQYFYFVHRRTFAVIYNKSILAEVIKTSMRDLGYKSITFSRYMEVKRKATGETRRRPS